MLHTKFAPRKAPPIRKAADGGNRVVRVVNASRECGFGLSRDENFRLTLRLDGDLTLDMLVSDMEQGRHFRFSPDTVWKEMSLRMTEQIRKEVYNALAEHGLLCR